MTNTDFWKHIERLSSKGTMPAGLNNWNKYVV